MGRKKKKFKPIIFCYYCDRTFENEKVLIGHQRAKHFKCIVCHKRLGSAHGMMVHVFQVHKQQIDKVPHAREGRDSFSVDIFGMSNIPQAVIDEKHAIERGEPPRKRQKLSSDGTNTTTTTTTTATEVTSVTTTVPPQTSATNITAPVPQANQAMIPQSIPQPMPQSMAHMRPPMPPMNHMFAGASMPHNAMMNPMMMGGLGHPMMMGGAPMNPMMMNPMARPPMPPPGMTMPFHHPYMNRPHPAAPQPPFMNHPGFHAPPHVQQQLHPPPPPPHSGIVERPHAGVVIIPSGGMPASAIKNNGEGSVVNGVENGSGVAENANVASTDKVVEEKVKEKKKDKKHVLLYSEEMVSMEEQRFMHATYHWKDSVQQTVQ